MRISFSRLSIILGCLSLLAATGVHAGTVAYEVDKSIHITGDGWLPVLQNASSPQFSGDGKKLAFIRDDSLFVLDKNQQQSSLIKKFCDRINDLPYDDFRTTISWHPSGKYILVSKPERFIEAGKGDLRHTIKSTGRGRSYIMYAVWLVDVASGNGKLILHPRHVDRGISEQIESAGRSIHNATFILNGSKILYAVDNDLKIANFPANTAMRDGIPPSRRVASFGSGIVYSNKTWEVSATTGIIDMAWSEKHHCLYVYTERFFGTGLARYQYIESSGGKWGKPQDYVDFGDEVLDAAPNIRSCSIDEKGNLLVRHFDDGKNDWIWSSTKSGASLPPNADNPVFAY